MEGGQEHKSGAPGGKQAAKPDGGGGGDIEARLLKAIQAGGDEAIGKELAGHLAEHERPLARMLLVRELSPARADALWAKSFPDEPVAAPPPAHHHRASPNAELALAQARELQASLHASLMQMRAQPEQMMQPLRAALPHVADAALTGLHAQPFDGRRSAYQILDELSRGGAKSLLAKTAQHDAPDGKKLDFRSGAARQWASKVVAALESGTTPAAIASSLLQPSTAPAWASLRLALQSQPSRLPALVEQMLDHLETMLKGAATGQVVPAELAQRIAAELGPITARIHTGPEAEAVAADHGAKALTIGQDVFIGADQWKPGTPEGDFLIAHELAHVAQVQQKRLHEAAPLAIETGRVVNESEVEADLRARLIVARGNYQVQVPPAPTATGLAVDSAQRTAQLDAQRSRMALGSKQATTTPAAAAPPVAAAGVEPVDAKALPAHRVVEAAQGSAGAYRSVFSAPPSQQPYDWDQAGDHASTQLKSEETHAVATLPSLDAELEGKDAGQKAGDAGAGAMAKLDVKAGADALPKTTVAPLPTLPSNQTGVTALADHAADKTRLKAEGLRFFQALRTRDEGLKTQPGPNPVVELSGSTDPAQTVEAEGQAKQQTSDELVKQRDKILTGPGPAQVQPQKLDEKMKVSAGDLALGPMPTLPSVADMDLMKGWKRHTTGPVKGAFDEIAQPKISATIAPAAAKVTDATSERESARAKTIAEAQQKTAAANTEARAKQAATVQAARTTIAAEQRSTLDQQKQAVAQVEEKANTKRTATLSKVDARIATDQAQIASQYAAADAQAQAEQRRGEQEAAQHRAEAERQSQNQSWWDRAVSTVTSAIQSIASAIDHVLTAVRDAVGHIIDAVKNAAMAVIEAARSFIVAAIAEFGHWLQDLVNATIGQLFPELAARLNAFIDRAVSAATAAVNAVAGALRRAVAALLDGLKAGLNALIDAYRAAVRAAAAFATALVTGDWSVVGRMLLEGILRLCGIDPAQFYALVGQARETLHLILDDPGAFANHVVDAVKGGFAQFGANFLTHLRDGVVQWMFGQFAEQGITMPARWDVAGVFGLVAQVLGLTYPRLRQKAVRLIGERNVARIEWVYEHIMALITGGWDGLWERIQQDLSGLWDTVVEGVKSWLMERVVQAALIRLATMWNPAGAIINLIMTAWNVYQWVRENAQRLFGLVQAVTQSMSEIAHGNIANAQNFIEGSLARLMPIAISLLANLLGLGGIADRIRDIITRIQSTVDTAIDRLIERVMAMFRGGGDKEKKDKEKDVEASFGKEITFDAKGHSHKLWLAPHGEHHEVMVASEPVPARQHLEHMLGQIDRTPADPNIGVMRGTHRDALRELVLLQEATTRLELARRQNPAASDAEVVRMEGELARLMGILFGLFDGQNTADLQAACTTAGGAALDVFNRLNAERAVVNWSQFVAGAGVRLSQQRAPNPLQAMLDEVNANAAAYINKGAVLPVTVGITKIIDIEALYDHYVNNAAKAQFSDFTAFIAAACENLVDPRISLNESTEIQAGANDPSVFAATEDLPRNVANIGQLRETFPFNESGFTRGYARFEISPASLNLILDRTRRQLHRATAWDFLLANPTAGRNPTWSPGNSAWGCSTNPAVRQATLRGAQIADVTTRRITAIPRLSRGEGVNRALRGFQNRQWMIGAYTVQLDRSGMRHILERHHPDYWDGSIRPDQSFFAPGTTLEAVADVVSELINTLRGEIARIAPDPLRQGEASAVPGSSRGANPMLMWNLTGRSRLGVSYQIGFQSARVSGPGAIINVGQLYPRMFE